MLAAIVMMTLSGVLDLSRMLHTKEVTNMLWSNEEIALAANFRAISEPTDTVLASGKHNLWVANLTGRQMILGYPGWIWTYGIDYTQRQQQIEKMFSGDSDANALFDTFGVRFVVIGTGDRDNYRINMVYLKSKGTVVLETDNYVVIKVH